MAEIDSKVAVNTVNIDWNEKEIYRLEKTKANRIMFDIVKGLVFGMVGLILLGFAGFLIDLVFLK